MDRSKVRISLMVTGIIAGLTLILYLPVLIWSPLWGEKGYYPSKIIVAYGAQPKINTVGEYFYARNLKAVLPGNSNDWSYSNIDQLSITDNDPFIEQLRKHKTSNPFTLWHIKWIEWTN